MTPSAPIRPAALVFSDLDGTLLDHRTYDYGPARPALADLAARGVPLVLATSKTAAEVAPLHAALGLGDAPAIVENGAGLYRPGDREDTGAEHARLRAALAALPDDLRAGFRGFSEMDAGEVAARTGLDRAAAARAKDRHFSEPGLWTGDATTRAAFCEALARDGIVAVEGGRFLTLSFGADKAARMAEIAQDYGAPPTLGLGDAPNDIAMIEAADRGVIVANPHGPGIPPLPGEATGRITRTELPGPAGWNRAVLDALNPPATGRERSSHG